MKWMIIALTFALAACGTSSEVRKNYERTATDKFVVEIVNTGAMSEEGLAILRQHLDATLATLGRLAGTGDAAAHKVKVVITGYRMRHGATRALVGIMAGRDSITSTVEIFDTSGAVVGTIDIDSKNSTAWGTSKGLIEGHADEIVEFISGAKR